MSSQKEKETMYWDGDKPIRLEDFTIIESVYEDKTPAIKALDDTLEWYSRNVSVSHIGHRRVSDKEAFITFAIPKWNPQRSQILTAHVILEGMAVALPE